MYAQKAMQAHPRPGRVKYLTAAVLKAARMSRDRELWPPVGWHLRKRPGIVRIALSVLRMKLRSADTRHPSALSA